MRPAASTATWACRPGFVGDWSTTRGVERGHKGSRRPAPPWRNGRRAGLLLGRITRVGSTREGRLFLTVHTDDGEIALHAAPAMRVVDAEESLPPGDLWHHVGSEVLIALGREGRLRVIESVTVQ